MLDHPLPGLDDWVLYFSNQELPVLRHTQRQINAARAQMHRVSGKEITQIILQDPLMAVKVLAYIQPLVAQRLHHDITTIAGAIMMMGIEPFFKHFEQLTTLEDLLKNSPPDVLLSTLQVIRRAQQAARYAHDWSIWRVDHHPEEVVLAALFHDLSEILLHCFAPKMAMQIRHEQHQRPGLRSATAQHEVLGITLHEIQQGLCKAWNLPQLLQELSRDEHMERPRVQNVILAVNLARHLANGPDDPALPDDIQAIAHLLNLSEHTLRTKLGLPLHETQAPPA